MRPWKTFLFWMAAILPLAAHAARAPIRHYTATDGFAESRVNRLRIDPSGVVWIAGGSGLWKFDGERFEALGTELGLPRAEVQDVTLGTDGTLWVATDEGLFRGDPSRAVGGPVFSRTDFGAPEEGSAPAPFRLLAAGDGSIWIGTRHGLWRIPAADGPGGARPSPVKVDGVPERGRVTSLVEGPGGAVWVGTHLSGLYRVARDGRIDHHPDDVAGYGFVSDILFDDDGTVWTAFLGGVAHFGSDPFGTPRPQMTLFGEHEGVSLSPTSLLRLERDRFLVGTLAGLDDVRRGTKGAWTVADHLDRGSGLPDAAVQALAFDREGNLWIGMFYGGLAKRVAGGFTQHDEIEARRSIIVGITGDRLGGVAVLARGVTDLTVYTSEGDRLVGRPLELPMRAALAGWRTAQQLAEAPTGGWWVAGSEGLLHYPRPAAANEEGALRRDLGPIVEAHLDRLEAAAVFVAASGDLWVSSDRGGNGSSSVACRRPNGEVRTFPASVVGTGSIATSFAEDGGHDIWIAFEDGHVVRYRGGRFELRPVPVDAISETPFFVDGAGALWVLGRGLAVCANPTADEPEFRRQAIPPAYADLALTCATDDRDGRLYLGSPRGVLRLDRASGTTRLFTAEDGLPKGEIRYAFRDALGRLWFADAITLAQLAPGPDPPSPESPARLRAVVIAGVPQPLPLLGVASVGPLTLPASQRALRIEYFAVHHGPGAPPQFRTRLEGADADWSAPNDERSVLYSNLAPGDYRFLVTSSAAPNAPPATVVFRVQVPFFERGWFIALVAAAAVAAAFGAYRVRVAHLLTVERLRTRIATDLHDEVGSSLSQIAVLSQVAEQGSRGPERAASPALDRITELSGNLVDAMSDTVWAISPREDRLSDLVHRMRRFASDLFADGRTAVRLDLPEADHEERLDPDVRRAIYLVCKESLHNVRKHAEARNAQVRLERLEGGFRLTVADDGRGFDVAAIVPGHGLASMRARAEALGGQLSIESRAGQGTTIVLRIGRPMRSLSRLIVWRRRNRV
ncbi:MAG TPA: two-component regulator propeller domain-containing protein [Candidatus Sulfotelmatobacter sp.]|jgi:signal transduction histidine kinase/ligand-binding sensor domain-containing protein|nr:two-component regulator propeller domain-containing protein [Candidatus Sulfotelmatobacter sp.]